MAAGTLAGIYRCRAHERAFTYDAHWEERDDKVWWRARIGHRQRMIEASAALLGADRHDAGGAVKRALEAWIEEFSCANAPPWPTQAVRAM